jgi:phage baseplate assembly protein W
MTNWGERLGIYDYGANLRSLLSEMSNNTNIDNEVMRLINDAVSKFMPFISLETLDMKFLQSDRNAQAKYQIIVNYSVPRINVRNQKVKIILEAMG